MEFSLFRVPCSVSRVVIARVVVLSHFVALSRAHADHSVRTRPPRAHRAEFPPVPCAPEAFPRTGLVSCARGGGQKYVAESELAYGTRFTRGRRLLRAGRRWQGLNTKASPLPPPASAPSANAPFPHGLTGHLQCSATPPQQRLGYFCLFFPLPSGGIVRVQRSTVSPPSKVGVFMAISSPTFRKRCPYTALCGTQPAKVGVFFAIFTPTSWTAPDPCSTLFPPSKVHPPTIKLAWRTPQCRFLYRTVSRVPRVQKGAGFLYRTCLKAARVQERAVFCTECGASTALPAQVLF